MVYLMKFIGSAKLSTQGQIVLPKDVREQLKLEPGEYLLFLQDQKGKIYVTKEVEMPD
ncbi:MAG: AbrB/MazE/SpoVT family DNA-binding domain-containing protein [Candidatus Heimdallarchaeota archaeon]|nr:AbrB/MazE/SpoVT family DNA-binding domain-containing protein [Candidatus Heimdallarchaeota archaeon]